MVAVAEISGGRGKSVSSQGSAGLAPDVVLRSTLSAFAVALAWGAVPGLVYANPTGGVAVVGQASMVDKGNQLQVTTQNGIGLNHSAINWQSFSIPAGSGTYFQQPNAASTVINRVISNTPSQLFGTMGSNGKLVLINQSGITVGAGAVIDTAGFTASALGMADADVLLGRLRFGNGTVGGNVSVQGQVLARSGDVLLIGSQVDTAAGALIQAPNGSTVLAAGRQVEVTGRGLEGITLQVQAPSDAAVNLGTLQGSAVALFAGNLRNSGLIQATSVTRQGGRVLLQAKGDALLDGSSRIEASGTQGGTVDVLGQRVGVLDQARVDASGSGQGGTVRIGGDAQASAAGQAVAQFVYVGGDAQIAADGGSQGGQVTVWADDSTRMHGHISARGGAQGGQVETSGRTALDIAGARVDAAGSAGHNGQWLLDPADVTIVHGVAGLLAGGLFDPLTNSTIGDTLINTALNAGTDVSIQTTTGSGGSGAIVVNGSSDSGGAVAIANSSGGTRGLTLGTSGTINIHSGASIAGSSGNALNVTLSATGGSTINGTIDNRGGTTTLTGATSLGGTLRNGTLLSNAALTSNSATLDGVTIGSNLSINGSLNLTGGLTLANGVGVNKNNNYWYFGGAGLQHLAMQGGSGSATITSAGGVFYAGVTSGGTLQIDAGVTLQGYGQIADYNTSALINNGSILANVAGQTFTLNPTTVTNNGTLAVSSTATLNLNPTNFVNTSLGTVTASAGSTLNLTAPNFNNAGSISLGGASHTLGTSYYNGSTTVYTAIVNSGSIALANGTLNLNVSGTTGGLGSSLGGLFSSRTAGTTLNFGGTLDNTGATLNVGSAGLFGTGGLSSLSGSISNGTLLSTDANPVFNSNSATLGGVTIGSNLSINGSLNLTGGLTLANGVGVNKNNNYWYFGGAGLQHLAMQGGSGSATITSAGGVFYAGVTSGGTLQIDAGVTLQGYGQIADYNTSALINNGSILANVAGQTFTLNTTTLTNNGTLGVAAGATIYRGSGFTSNSGSTLAGSGTIDVGTNNTLTSNGVIAPGIAGADTTGTLTINGKLVMGAGSSLNVDINSPLVGDYDKLSVSGTANLGGATLNLSGGASSGSLVIVNAAGGLGGSTFGTINNGTFTQTPSYAANTLTLAVSGNSNASIFWDGGAGTSNWMDALNWSNDQLPTLGSTLYVGSGAGTVIASGSGMAANALNMDANFTLSAGDLTLAGASNFRGTTTISGGTLTGSGTLTFAPGAVLNWSGGTITGTAASSLVTQAGSSTTVTGGTLGSYRSWANTGTVSIAPAAWTNAGSFSHDGGTLNLTGNFGSAALFPIARGVGSIVNVTGVLDLGGGSVDIGGGGAFGSGGLSALSGTIKGGTLGSGDGTPLTTTGVATLDSITVGSNLGVNGALYVLGGLTLSNGITLNKGSGTWYMNTGSLQHLALKNGATAATITNAGGTLYASYASGGSLQIDSGVTLQGYGSVVDYYSSTLTNFGSIVANVPTQTLAITTANVANASGGVLAASGGTLSLSPGSSTVNWSNAGQIQANSGALILGGKFSTAELAGSHYTRSSGSTVTLSGILDLGSTDTLDIGSTGLFGTGGLNTLSGTIKNGTLTSSGNALALSGAATLDTITVGSSLGINGTLTVLGGLTLADGVVVSKDGGTWYMNTGAPQHLALQNGATSATLNSAGGTIYASYAAGGSLVVDSGVTVQGYGQFYDNYASTFTNNGSLIANVAGQTLTVSTSNLQNNGSVTASTGILSLNATTFSNAGALYASGGTLNITPSSSTVNWSNTGVIHADNGALNLGGKFSPSALTNGHYVRSGSGSVNITGLLDLGSTALDIGSTGLFGTGGLSSLSGTIKGGTLSSSDGTALQSSGNGTLDSMTVGSNLTVTGSLTLLGGLTLADGITLNKGNGTWYLNTGAVQHLALQAGASAAAINNAGGTIYLSYASGGSTVIDSGVTVQGYGQLYDNYSSSFTNNGSLLADTAGQTQYVSTNSFVNNGLAAASAGTLALNSTSINNAANGVLRANGGTLAITPGSNTVNWGNAGHIQLTAGTLNLGGKFSPTELASGHFSRSGGTLNLSGILDLGGNALDIGGTGLFGSGGLNGFGGTIKGGALGSGDGSVLVGGGTLDTITVGSNLTINGSLTLLGGLTLADGIAVNKGNGTWYLNSGAVQHLALQGGATSATINNAGGTIYVSYANGGSTVIDSGVTLQGFGQIYDNYSSSFTNNGTLLASTAGQTLNINTNGFVNNGTLGVATGGTLYRPSGFVNNGVLSGAGNITVGTGASALVNHGSINPGGSNTAGILSISGDLTLGSGSVINAELGGIGLFDTLAVSGTVSGNAGSFGTLNVSHINNFGYANASGDSFRLINAGSLAASTSFAAINGARATLTPSYSSTAFTLGSTPYTLTVTPDALGKVYGAADPGFSYSASGFDSNTGDSLATAFSGSLGRVAGNSVGSYSYTLGNLSSPLGYAIVLGGSNQFGITPATLTVTANNASKAYDGLAYSGGNGVGYAGLVLGDTAGSLSGTLAYGGTAQGAINAGSYSIRPSGLSSPNYSINYVDGQLTIATLGIRIDLTGTRTYDGSNVVNANIFTLGGLVGGQTLTLSGAGTVASQNVGSYSVNLGTLALGDGSNGGLAANYTLLTGTHVASITAAPLSLSASKVYDGTTDVRTAVQLGGLIGNETLAIASAAANDAHVASSGKFIQSIALADGSGLAGNYALPTLNAANAPVAISARPVSASASIVPVAKVYDGTRVATGSTLSSSVSGAVASDTLGLDSSSVTLQYNDAHVANATTISASGTPALAIRSSGSGLQNGSDSANRVVALPSDYVLSSPPSISPVAARIQARPLGATVTIGGTLSKTYDGTTSASGALVQGTVTGALVGDTVALDLTPVGLAYNSSDVATANAILASGTPLLGLQGSGNISQASDYQIVPPVVPPAVASITPRAAVTWHLGGSSNLWSDPSNWDLLPSSGNVLSAVIPSGASVVFDATAASTSLQSITSSGTVTVTGGVLSVANALNTDRLIQTGGQVTGGGSVTVNSDFSQSAGAIAVSGAVSLTQASGNLVVGRVSGSRVSLSAPTGSVSQTAAVTTSGLLQVQAGQDVALTQAGNSVAAFSASSTGGNVSLVNSGALDLQGVALAQGNLQIDNTGAVRNSGALLVRGGNVTIQAHSPIRVDNAITADGNIVLSALTPNSSGASRIDINAALTSTAGAITVQAYDSVQQNARLSAALGLDISTVAGSLGFGPNAFSSGNPVSYSQGGTAYTPPWVSATLSGGVSDFVLAFSDSFAAAVGEQQVATADDPLAQKKRAKDSVAVEGDSCKP